MLWTRLTEITHHGEIPLRHVSDALEQDPYTYIHERPSRQDRDKQYAGAHCAERA